MITDVGGMKARCDEEGCRRVYKPGKRVSGDDMVLLLGSLGWTRRWDADHHRVIDLCRYHSS